MSGSNIPGSTAGPEAHARAVQFGVFVADLSARELRKHGLRLKIQDQPFQVLAMLLERPGVIVTREELRRRLWSEDTFVDFDHSLNISINKLRDALGDTASNPRFIETFPRRGYRFLFPVEVVQADPAEFTTKAAEGRLSLQAHSHAQKSRRWVWMAVASLAVALVSFFTWGRLASRAKLPDRRMVLAVLPFENLTRNPDQDYFISGLNEEMIRRLGRSQPARLGVIARSSVVQYRANPKPVAEVGRELNADFILEGSVQRSGDRLRIAAQLVQSSDQTQLWADTYDLNLSDLFAVQTEVATRVANALRLELLPKEREMMSRSGTTSMEAHEAYFMGRYLLSRRTRENFEKAASSFELALKLDPNYAQAYSGLADCFNLMGGYNYLPPQEAFPKAKAMAQKALELDSTLAPAYTSLAFASFHYDWNWAVADNYYQYAIRLDPNYSIAHQWYAEFLHAMGRYDEALAEVNRARELDPLSLVLCDVAGWIQLSRRENDKAIQLFQRAHEIDASWPKAYFSLAFAYARSGQFEKAREEIAEARKIAPSAVNVHEYFGYVQALGGHPEQARESLAWLERESRRTRVSNYSLALIHLALGEKRQAIALLQKACDDRDNWVIWLSSLHEWDDLKTEPGFLALLNRIGLKP